MSSNPSQPETVETEHATASFQPTEGAGLTLGRYTLEQRLGEGGMGSVWIARQSEPVKRLVALKLIKTGLDSRSMLARFDQERQALAVMDHPNIAKVYDAGAINQQPYFVMELVRGPTLLQYCDQQKLTPRQRLELFIPICHAVQHAHQKGIIHRDLKPANILVAAVDGQPQPKIIDFGVAKAVSGKLTDQSFNTVLGSVVGTLEYMPPEQAAGQDDVDTRADVYALGVILYELLVGVRPFDGARLRQAALLEAIRIIKDEDPSKPSTRLSTEKNLPSIAAVRQLEPQQLLNLLKGDLDWIIMKCLEKERNRRYETANGLAMELQRYLQDEPVLASPPSALYRWRKFVRRNRGAVLAGSAMAFLLLAGIIGTSWAALIAREQAMLAKRESEDKEAARIAERDAKLLTQKRLVQIQKAQRLLGTIFTALDPQNIRLSQRALRQQLLEGIQSVDKELNEDSIGDPGAVAELQVVLAQAYHGLGQYDRARELFQRAADLIEKVHGKESAEYLSVRSNQATNECSAGSLTLAADQFQELIQQHERLHGRQHPETMKLVADLGGVYSNMQRTDRALPLLKEALQFFETKPEYQAQRLYILKELCGCYAVGRKPDEALKLIDRILPTLEKAATAKRLSLAEIYKYQGMAYRELNESKKAADAMERALTIFEETLDKDHQSILNTRNNLLALLWDTGQFERALPGFEKLYKEQEQKHGTIHHNTMLALANLAVQYRDGKQPVKALEKMELFLERFPRMEKASRVHCAWFLTDAADLCKQANQPAREKQLLDQYLQFVRGHFKADHPDIAYGLLLLAGYHRDKNELQEAERLARECLTMREKTEPEDWSTFNTRSFLGEIILKRGQLGSDAEKQASLKESGPLLLSGYEGIKQRQARIQPPVRPKVLGKALERLILHAELSQKPEEAAKWKAELEKAAK